MVTVTNQDISSPNKQNKRSLVGSISNKSNKRTLVEASESSLVRCCNEPASGNTIQVSLPWLFSLLIFLICSVMKEEGCHFVWLHPKKLANDNGKFQPFLKMYLLLKYNHFPLVK